MELLAHGVRKENTMIKGRTGGDSKFVGGRRGACRAWEGQRESLGGETLGEAGTKPDVGRCEVMDDGETSFSFSTNTFTGNLPWGRLSKWQVVESGGFRSKKM